MPALPQFQSPSEASDIRAALLSLDHAAEPGSPPPPPAPPKPWSKGRKLSPARLFEHLNQAASAGNLADLQELLALGAPIMAPASAKIDAWRRPNAGSALRSALGARQQLCAAALLRQPEPLGPGMPKDALWSLMARQGSLEIFKEFSVPEDERHAKDRPWPTLQRWLELACSQHRLDVAERLSDLCPQPINSASLDAIGGALCSALQWGDLAEPGSVQEENYKAARSLLQKSAPRVSQALAVKCFVAAVDMDSAGSLRFLLEIGLKPSADWTISPRDGEERVPLALMAYAQASERAKKGARGSCFELLSRVPPIMSAAIRIGAPPSFLRKLSWSELVALETMGVDIARPDHKGEIFSHRWACETASDSLPKLKTLLRERPELMSKAGHDGLTPAELALRLYPPSAREDLRRAMISLEKKEIRAETPAPAKCFKKTKSRL